MWLKKQFGKDKFGLGSKAVVLKPLAFDQIPI